MVQIVRERCGNCVSFEPLSQEVLEKYKDDPRVHNGDGTCAKGPFLAHPHVRPGDRCNPSKLITELQHHVEDFSDLDRMSKFEPKPGQESRRSLRIKLQKRKAQEIFNKKREKEIVEDLKNPAGW
jgi:hypothetical protein